VRLYTRNAYDWTARLLAIAAAAARIKGKSFAIDGEMVVLGPDGLSRFEEQLRSRPIPVTKFSFTIPTGYFGPRSCNGPTVVLCMCFLHLDWWLPSPRPSGGH
jgi:hypothetical protein